MLVGGARDYRDALVAPRPRARGHALRRAHARRPRRAHDLRRQARRVRVRGRTATCAGWSAPSRACRWARSRARSAPTRRTGPRSRRRVLRRLGPGARGRLDPGGAARPPRRAARARSRSPAPGSSASPPRSATSSAPRCARWRSRSGRAPRRARRRCRTSATRSSSERITGIARLLRGYAQAGLENVALWHERDISHSSVERVALPDATILLDYAQHLAVRRRRRHDRPRGADAREPRGHARRALLAARAARAGGGGPLARRRLPRGAGGGPARLGRGHATSASCWPSGARSSTSTRVFDPGAFVRQRTRSSIGSTARHGSRARWASPRPEGCC